MAKPRPAPEPDTLELILQGIQEIKERLSALEKACGIEPAQDKPAEDRPAQDKPEVSGNELLMASQVMKRVNLSRSTFYNLVNTNRFPPGVNMGNGYQRWRVSDVDAWVASLPATRKKSAKRAR